MNLKDVLFAHAYRAEQDWKESLNKLYEKNNPAAVFPNQIAYAKWGIMERVLDDAGLLEEYDHWAASLVNYVPENAHK